MADVGPVAGPELADQQQHSPEPSPEVKSKLGPKRKMPSGPPLSESATHPDTKFDRQAVFLMMASGQIESAEVTLGGKKD